MWLDWEFNRLRADIGLPEVLRNQASLNSVWDCACWLPVVKLMNLCGWAYRAFKSLLAAMCWGSRRWWWLSWLSVAAVPAFRGRVRRLSAGPLTALSAAGVSRPSPASDGRVLPTLAACICSISVKVAYGQMSSSSAGAAALKSASRRWRSLAVGGVGRWTSSVADEKWTEKMTSSMLDVDALLYERLQYSAIDRAPLRFRRSLPPLHSRNKWRFSSHQT